MYHKRRREGIVILTTRRKGLSKELEEKEITALSQRKSERKIS